MKYFVRIFIFYTSLLFSQSHPIGTIEGTVVDAGTQQPLVGVNVMILNSTLGAVSSTDGTFVIPALPVGSYSVQFRMIGHATVTVTDVIVRPQRNTTVNAELPESMLETEQVEVTAGYFNQADVQAMNSVGLSREEIRRAPGSGGDVSRIIMSLPSIAKVNDQSNALIVRGGSPLENAFYIDGIEVPNINHFPTQGASGGPIGMINVDLIDDVTFHTGGFSPSFGDKLSSIMEMRFREGNKKEFNGQFDLSIMGFGGVAEGPFSEYGSYILSVRRSYLDYVMKLFDIGTTVAPNYGDTQGKISFDLSSKHKLSVIGLFGDDHNNPDLKAAIENTMQYYGNQDIYQGAGGIVWRALWNGSAYSTSTLSVMSSQYKEDFFDTNTGTHLMKNRSKESALSFRSINHIKASERHSFEFGIDIKHLMNDYDNFYGAFSDASGDSTSSAFIIKNISANKIGGFLNYIVQPFGSLTGTLGVRVDYFSLNKRVTTSPRGSLAYRLDGLTTFRVSSGIYYQNIPLLLLSQHTENISLKDPYAVHYIAGVDRLLTEDTRLSVEAYLKEYYGFPVDPSEPSLFLVDEIFYRYGFFFNHGILTSDGRARSQGIEITVQKKLAKDFYGLASASFFKTEYKGAENIWRKRVFDNRMMVSIEGGYKLNSEWEFSARWIYAGGTPYTPLDLAQTELLNREVLDKTKINDARYPAYHSLNIRVDKRFHFQRSNLVVYISAWNAYNRKNVATYFWNGDKQKIDTIYQWNLLPIFGVEYEL